MNESSQIVFTIVNQGSGSLENEKSKMGCLEYFMEGRPFSDQILSDGLLASWQGSVSIHESRQGTACNRANAQFKSKNSVAYKKQLADAQQQHVHIYLSGRAH